MTKDLSLSRTHNTHQVDDEDYDRFGVRIISKLRRMGGTNNNCLNSYKIQLNITNMTILGLPSCHRKDINTIVVWDKNAILAQKIWKPNYLIRLE